MKISRRYAILGLATLGFTPAPAVTITRPATAFGTVVKLSVTAPTSEIAEACVTAGFAEIRKVEAAFNLFNAKSEVSLLNTYSVLENASPLMQEILAQSRAMHALTDGAFDPTVQSLWNLWSKASPKPTQIADALHGNGLHHVKTDGDRVLISNGKAQLTFDGIARGLACDRVAAVIAPLGASEAILDTDVTGFIGTPDTSFAIEHPRQAGVSLGTLKTNRGFIATSGDYGFPFTADFVNNHIYDPRTGYSPQELSSVTVISETGAKADALATAFMVMGSSKAAVLLAREAATGAILVGKDLSIKTFLKGGQSFFPAV